MDIKAHIMSLRQLPCIVSGGRTEHLHHARGGSLKCFGLHGMAMKSSDWFLLPLQSLFHTGAMGIHTLGPDTWEHRIGRTQLQLLENLSGRLGYNVFTRAGFDHPIEGLP